MAPSPFRPQRLDAVASTSAAARTMGPPPTKRIRTQASEAVAPPAVSHITGGGEAESELDWGKLAERIAKTAEWRRALDKDLIVGRRRGTGDTSRDAGDSDSNDDTHRKGRKRGKPRHCPSAKPRDLAPEAMQRFRQWCDSKGIWIHPALRVAHFTKDGRVKRTGDDTVAVYVQGDPQARFVIDYPEVVVKVPKTAVLSTRSSALAPYLAAHTPRRTYEQSHRTTLDLAFCLAYERILGEESAFKPYLDTLPADPVKLPIFRNQQPRFDIWRWFHGTEAHRKDRRARIAARPSWKATYGIEDKYGLCADVVAAYHEDVVVPVFDSTPYPPGRYRYRLCELADLQAAVALVMSRGFAVDLYHGLAMVPVCDLFNHKEKHTVEFESNEEVCVRCGSASAVRHPHVKANGSIDAPVDTVDMCPMGPHSSGDEMFNTYGPLSNAELLLHYGFCLGSRTKMDRGTWDLRFAKERQQLGYFLGIDDWDDIFDRCLALAPTGSESEGDAHKNEAEKRVASLRFLDYDIRDWEDEIEGGLLERDTDFFDDRFSVAMPLTRTEAIDCYDRKIEDLMEYELKNIKEEDLNPVAYHGNGSVSRVLWRLAMLAQLPRKRLGIDDVRRILEIERQMGLVLSEWTLIPEPDTESDAFHILAEVVHNVKELLSDRRAGLYYHVHQAEGIELFEQKTGRNSTLHSILRHARAEEKALSRLVARFDALQEAMHSHVLAAEARHAICDICGCKSDCYCSPESESEYDSDDPRFDTKERRYHRQLFARTPIDPDGGGEMPAQVLSLS